MDVKWHDHFSCKDLVHHPIETSIFSGCFRFRVYVYIYICISEQDAGFAPASYSPVAPASYSSPSSQSVKALFWGEALACWGSGVRIFKMAPIPDTQWDWYIYLHLVHFYGEYRKTDHTLNLWEFLFLELYGLQRQFLVLWPEGCFVYFCVFEHDIEEIHVFLGGESRCE